MKRNPSPRITFIIFIALAMGFWFTMWHQVSGGSLDVFRKWGWNAITNTSNINAGNYQLTGLGWTSFNCLNDYDNDGKDESRCRDFNYGLNVNIDGSNASSTGALGGNDDYVQGCIWSATFGWICFDQDGSYCPSNSNNPGCTKLSDSGVKILKHSTYPIYYLDNSDPNTTPSARASILSLAETGKEARSYIGFPADFSSNAQVDKNSLGTKIMNCIGCTGFFTGSCDLCMITSDGTYTDSNEAPNPNILCTQCSSCTVLSRGGSCGGAGNPNDHYCNPSSCAACFHSKGTIVNYYKTCTTDSSFCTVDTNCTGTGAKCNYKNSKAELCGWGYNAYNEPDGTKTTGLTWIAWNPALYGQATPFFQGRSGSIYSRFDIRTFRSLPSGRYNATYLIDAGSTISPYVVSASSTASLNLIRPGLSQPPSFPSLLSSNSLFATSSLGYIDIGGLINEVTTGVNKYGSQIVDINDTLWPHTINDIWKEDSNTGVTLNDRVFYVRPTADSDRRVGDITANPNLPKHIKPGTGTKSGSGVIVVEGDLDIQTNIIYDSGTIARLKQIPSLVWIVKGDVTINPAVTQVDGTFIILGDGIHKECDQIGDPLNPSVSNHCGRFSSGNDAASRRQLRMNGQVIARQFNLQRSFVGDPSYPEPAEQIIADGRLQANPPVGLSDFGKRLPRFNYGF